jgi:hypothetical protein
MQNDVQAFALALDDVVYSLRSVEAVAGDETLEVLFDTGRENEAGEGFIVPFDLIDTRK